MSVNISIGDVLLVRHQFVDQQASTIFNLLHYRVTSVVDQVSGLPPAIAVPMATVAAGLAAGLNDDYAERWASMSSQQTACVGTMVQNIYPEPRSQPFNYLRPVPRAGEEDSDALPSQDCITILKRTDYGERWGLGRTFLFGIPEAMQADGIVSADYADFANALGSSLVLPITYTAGGYVIGLRQVLYAPVAGGPARVLDVRSMPISDRIIKTQRRRRPGKGQ